MTSRIIHLGIMVFALAAYLTGDMADDYKRLACSGFTFHKWLGMGAAFFITGRILYGFWGTKRARFSSWAPCTRDRLKYAGEALLSALSYKRPGATAHRYIAGLVKAAGLVLFSWMSFTGMFMFFFVEPGSRSRGLVHLVMEVHEVGEALIPAYLFIHIAIAIIHAFYGQDFWRKMLFVKKKPVKA
ncbi:MAG: cytochrome b/b6 domain-containing protein [Deltaproteobacteria bacterium]|nr:cytochrome b/b6 domain-containing protein [Deltaproteobacteria bacterium]